MPESDCLVLRTARQGRAIAEQAERFDTIGVSLKSVDTLPSHCGCVPESDCLVPRTARQGRAIAEEAERIDRTDVSLKSVPPLHCVMPAVALVLVVSR